jgi:hypothetical protein
MHCHIAVLRPSLCRWSSIPQCNRQVWRTDEPFNNGHRALGLKVCLSGKVVAAFARMLHRRSEPVAHYSRAGLDECDGDVVISHGGKPQMSESASSRQQQS